MLSEAPCSPDGDSRHSIEPEEHACREEGGGAGWQRAWCPPRASCAARLPASANSVQRMPAPIPRVFAVQRSARPTSSARCQKERGSGAPGHLSLLEMPRQRRPSAQGGLAAGPGTAGCLGAGRAAACECPRAAAANAPGCCRCLPTASCLLPELQCLTVCRESKSAVSKEGRSAGACERGKKGTAPRAIEGPRGRTKERKRGSASCLGQERMWLQGEAGRNGVVWSDIRRGGRHVCAGPA